MASSVHARRVTALQKALGKKTTPDAVLIHTPPNVRYFSGFEASYCFLVIGPEHALLLTDPRYIEAAKEVEGFTVHKKAQGGQPVELVGLVKKTKAERIGFEPELTYGTYGMLREVLGDKIELTPAGELLTGARQAKAAAEVKAIEASQRLNEKIFTEAVGYLREGGPGALTERQLVHVLKLIMLRYNVEPSFEPIVAHGRNGSKPHYHPGDTPIGKGATLIDMGVILDGYCSDMTRMIHFGPPKDDFAAAHDAVREAKNAAIKAIKPGVKGTAVHEKAVKVLKKEKLDERFTHGLGHGVGLEIHEAPRLAATSTDTLEAGHIVTVEPGVYIPGWGGIRIEDMVAVTRDGAKVLTALDDELLIL